MRKSIVVVIFMSFATLISACSSKHSDSTQTTNPDTPSSNEVGQGSNPGDAAATNNQNPTNNSTPTNTDQDAGSVGDASKPTAAECITACEVAHPVAAALSHDLDTSCFFGDACNKVCDNLVQGETKYPDAVSSAKCNTEAAKSYPIGTPSQACSNCLATTPVCCNLWIKIFSSVEGQDLNKCASDCWAKFPNK